MAAEPMVTEVIDLRFRNAEEVRDILKPLVAPR